MQVEEKGLFAIIRVEKTDDWQSVLEEALALADHYFVLLDVGRIEKMEPSQVMSFVNLSIYITSRGRRVILVSPTEETLRVINSMHPVKTVISMFDSVDMAIRTIKFI